MLVATGCKRIATMYLSGVEERITNYIQFFLFILNEVIGSVCKVRFLYVASENDKAIATFELKSPGS